MSRIDTIREFVTRNRVAVGAASLAVVVVATVIVLVTAGDEPGPSTDPVATTSTAVAGGTTQAAGPTVPGTTSAPPVSGVNPLSGQPFEGSGPVVAVKLDNTPDARPHIGLAAADLVFEAPVEGGLTRFTALYLSELPALVGPVRSARPVDADLLAPFAPVLVSTGGQQSVYRQLQGAGVDLVDQTSGDLFQTLERPAPVNLFLSLEIAAPGFPPRLPPVEALPFADVPGLEGTAAETVIIPFSATSTVEWRYDGTSYQRFDNDQPFQVLPTFDAAPEPYAVDTVLVQFAAQRSAGYTDSAGADVPTFDVIGFGRVLVFHGGRMVEGEWRRGAQEDGTALVDAAGNPLRIPPGRLLVEIVPRNLAVEFR